MLHLVRNNSPYTAILLFIFTLGTQLQSLMHPVLPLALPSQLCYGWLVQAFSVVLGNSAFAFSFIAVIIIYLQALLLNAIAARHRLFTQNTYLVAFAYVAVCSMHPAFGQFSSMLMVNLFLLFAINELLQLKQSHNANKHIFNIAFVLMLAALVHFSAIFLVLFLMAALLILRPFNFREWMILLVGLLMPLYMVSVLLFCTDKFHLLHLWPDLGISLPRQLKPGKYYLGLFSGLIIWLSIAWFNMQSNLPKAPIYIRRCWISLTLLLFVALLAAVFSDNQVNGVWIICLPALSLMMAHAFLNERNKKMNAISFYFALVLVLFCQLFLPL